MARLHSRMAWALVACAGLFGAASCSDDGPAPTIEVDAPEHEPAAIASDHELRTSMRDLWMDHVAWTRFYVMSAIADLPDADATAGRLLRNQEDIGAAIVPLYGDAAGRQLADLLKVHITGAVALVTAAKAGDEAALAEASDAWDANAQEIADFLADANPEIRREDIRMMMQHHLDQTVTEATARLELRWSDDVVSYDVIVDHILTMSDGLSAAIAEHLPEKVDEESAWTAEEQQLQVAMRDLWMDHVVWTRVFLISALAGLGDTDAATERLLRNQDDIGAAVATYYGAEAGAQLTALLREHITLAAEVVAEATAPPPADPVQPADEVTTPSRRAARIPALDRWRRNGDDIANFLADANPAWDREELKMLMHHHLETTLVEATARIEGRWADDVVAYDAVVDHILVMADALSAGIAAQFPQRFGR